MPKETIVRAADPAPDAPTADPTPTAAPAPKAGVYVVMHGAVSNWVRGCRVTIDDLFHEKHPTRQHAWERLIRLGAIKPATDPEAAAVPEAEPLPSPPPIVMTEAAGQITVTPRTRS